MKVRFFILYILLTVIFFACNSRVEIEQTSPKFNFPSDTIFTSHNDTLHVRGSFPNGFRVDSISAGDTAHFRIDIDGVFNQLTEIRIALSVADTIAELLFLDQAHMDSTFLSSSDFQAGIFHVAGGRTRIPFIFSYAAIQTSRNADLILTAHSDADEYNDENSFTLRVPIKRTPAPQFTLPENTFITDNNDTLQVSIVSSLHRLGAITVGDVVELQIAVSGVRNNLTLFKLTPRNPADTLKLPAEIIIPNASELSHIFPSIIWHENGVIEFEMDGNFSELTFTFKLYAKEASEDFGIIFEAHSDALFDYGISRFELRTPIQDLVSEE